MKEEINHQAEIEKKVNEGIVKLSREMGIPLIATNDAHYINKEDANTSTKEAEEFLNAIRKILSIALQRNNTD